MKIADGGAFGHDRHSQHLRTLQQCIAESDEEVRAGTVRRCVGAHKQQMAMTKFIGALDYLTSHTSKIKINAVDAAAIFRVTN